MAPYIDTYEKKCLKRKQEKMQEHNKFPTETYVSGEGANMTTKHIRYIFVRMVSEPRISAVLVHRPTRTTLMVSDFCLLM